MDPRRQLESLAEKNSLRTLTTLNFTDKNLRVVKNGRELWNFASNDYLGLSNHPEISRAFIEGIHLYGSGSAASRLVTGTSVAHTTLEESLAVAKHTEAALSFSSGYSTAISTLPIIVGKGDFVILDRLAHASLIDAARMSDATLRVFQHNDVDHLESLLQRIRSNHKNVKILVVTESVFSMDGDICPLKQLVESCEKHQAQLLLDEAHSIGVLGSTGMGLAEELGLQNRIDFQMGTLSKAVGLSGGYMATSRDWVDLFVNRSRPFIYTTAPPPALAHAATTAIRLIRSSEGEMLRQRLFENIHLLCENHPSAILPIITGDDASAVVAAAALSDLGYLIPAIRFPTVPKDKARIRVTISANHPAEVIGQLKQDLKRIFPQEQSV